MGTYAKIENGIVVDVIEATSEYIATLSGTWLETNQDGLRKNYAGKGYTYNEALECFVAPKPYPSWVLNESTCKWEPPTPMPVNSNRYKWVEETLSWGVI